MEDILSFFLYSLFISFYFNLLLYFLSNILFACDIIMLYIVSLCLSCKQEVVNDGGICEKKYKSQRYYWRFPSARSLRNYKPCQVVSVGSSTTQWRHSTRYLKKLRQFLNSTEFLSYKALLIFSLNEIIT